MTKPVQPNSRTRRPSADTHILLNQLSDAGQAVVGHEWEAAAELYNLAFQSARLQDDSQRTRVVEHIGAHIENLNKNLQRVGCAEGVKVLSDVLQKDAKDYADEAYYAKKVEQQERPGRESVFNPSKKDLR